MHPSSAEYSIVRTYLDWLAVLPWSKSSRDRLDLRRARKILDADHYDLEKIKERILEYLAVRKLKKDMKGPILCFAGPPGHGQDRRWARASPRPWAASSSGSAWAASTTRPRSAATAGPTSPPCPAGSSRGSARPGTNNPVFMLDEVDKLGSRLPRRPLRRAPGSARPRAERDLPRPLPRRRLRPLEGHVHRHGEHARDDPRRRCSTGWRCSSSPATARKRRP